MLRQEINDHLITGGNLQGYVKTRWVTAYDCTASILRLETCLKNVSIFTKKFYYIFFLIKTTLHNFYTTRLVFLTYIIY
jgi:hypothetical protein